MERQSIVMKTFAVGEKHYTLEIFTTEEDQTEVIDEDHNTLLTFTANCCVFIGTPARHEQLGRLSMNDKVWYFIQDDMAVCPMLVPTPARDIYDAEVFVAVAYFVAKGN